MISNIFRAKSASAFPKKMTVEITSEREFSPSSQKVFNNMLNMHSTRSTKNMVDSHTPKGDVKFMDNLCTNADQCPNFFNMRKIEKSLKDISDEANKLQKICNHLLNKISMKDDLYIKLCKESLNN